MNMLPDAWRTEMWHPLTVHFPVALLLAATFSLLVSFIFGGARSASWRNAATGLLFAGYILAWIALYTGNLADGIVSRKICDPTVLKDHENASFTTVYLFSSAVALHVLVFATWVNMWWRKRLYYFISIVMLIGSGYLIYTGHLGATLVYEQGAGVHKPLEDCSDFQY